ncbi:MAG: DNA mismatch repair endonuclease MutL [Desulfococcaceae bacterium]
MAKIRILPEILSNKIAAGEVVERPASVIKELLENALDAGADRIMIDVEKGGRSLIQVSDNGCGMGRDDALLAIERYATSKIHQDPDLFSIRTLGFRGEALPSVAAVSRFTMETREKRAAAGTRIEIEGGKLKNVAEVGAPVGTLITVRGLFFNTPARRKFLKTVNTEMGHIGDTVASMALGWPGVGFRLRHNDRPVKAWTAVSDPAERTADILGRELRKDLHPVESETEAATLTGWIATPRHTRSTSRSIYLYVNGRYVRDKVIQHALFAGYAGRIMKGAFPVAVLFLQVPPDQVDVNVHPTKHEVRFLRQKEVHQAVVDAVSRTLQEADRTKWGPPKVQTDLAPVTPIDDIEPAPPSKGPPRPPQKPVQVSEPARSYVSPGSTPRTAPLPETGKPQPASAPEGAAPQKPLWQARGFEDLKIIGQGLGTYILCESENGLVLIDQHAAHERILFEELKHRSSGLRTSAQRLLIPESLDLSYREAETLERLIPRFQEMGIEIEPFGGNTYVVKSVPAEWAHKPAEPMIREILEKILEIGIDVDLDRATEACRMVMACHGAIRAHQTLDNRQMRQLLHQLDRCDTPSHCPHGRPTWIRWSGRFLEKSFRRIV